VSVVHIAGTNGKGSVALKIAKTLELMGLEVGLFCSPHISSFRERMQMNSQLISEEEVVEYLPQIYALCEENDIPATFFEMTTALAFLFYHKRQADVVVLETGLGGRLDSTNVVKSPACSVITSIGLEHTRILGDTIEKIAVEKGGIIKPGRPVLVGTNVPHHVLRQCAAEKGASAYYTCEDILQGDDNKQELGQDITDYDLENARIATAALRLLEREQALPMLEGPIPSDIIDEGTSQRPPCRFEPVKQEDGLMVVLDVAHNPPAMEYLVRKLKTTYKDARFRMIVGMSSDKDSNLCGHYILEAVEGKPGSIHLVQASHPRAAKLEDILTKDSSGLLKDSHFDFDDRSVTRQIKLGTKLAKQNDEILVVCGSVFLMSEAREALGFDEPRDSDYIAEVAGAHLRHGQENFGKDGQQHDKEIDKK
jgi:dihydrofolate synthase/folylpolyglutamate synthase